MSRYVSGTRFRHITVHGADIPRTAFGDGFDTGDVLVCDRREHDGSPRFLAIVSRDGDTIGVADVGTMVSIQDLASDRAVAVPALGVTVNRVLVYRISDGVASFPDGSGIARPWDGHGIPVEA